MRVLFISDLHLYDLENDINISALRRLVDKFKPDIVLSAGDVGTDDLRVYEFIDSSYFKDVILQGVPFFTIYGNHDSKLDVKNDDGTPMQLEDGITKIGDISILSFNGIFGFHRKNWYHRSLDEAVKLAFRHRDSEPTIVLTHEVPYGDWTSKFKLPKYLNVINFLSEMTKPQVHLFGHLHIPEPYNVGEIDGVLYVRVDTRVKHLTYAVFDFVDGKLKDFVVDTFREV